MTLPGCRAAYLGQLAFEQVRYLSSARPIPELIAESDDPVRRARLELVLDARRFAESAGLEVGGSYRKVADTGAANPFHVVTAAYSNRLQPYKWWYPIVGRIPYRGYFDRADAEVFAAELGSRRLDTYIVTASAYSTLGWFDDPLPSNLLDHDEVALATVVLHELLHQTLFVPGHIDFNETLANAVAYRLAPLFFDSRGESERAELARRRRELWLGRTVLLDELAARLRDYFADARRAGLALSQVLDGRQAIYAEARERLATTSTGAHAGGKPAKATLDNNAAFLALYRYARRGTDIDAFLGRYASIAAALAALEERVEEVEDPYDLLQRAGVAGG